VGLILLGLVIPLVPVQAQYLEEESRLATDGASGSVFVENPAAIEASKTWITYANVKTQKKYDVVVNDNVETDVNALIDSTYHGAGISYPLGGGAAFGLAAQQIGRDLETRVDGRNNVFAESERVKHFSGKFIIDLTPNLRGGFAYRWTEVRKDILGNFNISENDRTKYLGTMTGYNLGIFYEKGKGGIGIGHHPGMRGKADVQGEEKIVTQRGYTVIDGYKESGKNRYGLVIKKYQYKRDDRAEVVDSFVDQRRMSLNGIDLEQFLFDTEFIMIGIDHKLNNEVDLKASLGRYKSVFLFDGEDVPGDDQDDEFPITSNIFSVGLTYGKSDFKVSGAYTLWERELEDFQDNDFWLSARQYDSYKAQRKTISVSISFVK